ncbi:trypsin-like peptidase domain-containing protein [Streptomyces sp. GESEQ-35]|uniref:nSTAND1 domain-containing NTPase n=1 Tax=Streptomyces sp. GESEQ-35 TaxID=2812657 RepID=UPI001B31BFEB|nr:trypsin-like peptidase domain-containing protein [Streptomyces sp. GESEQ-35]
MAAVLGSDVLEASQVRIRSAAGEVVGAGFLVAADVVCTCAHVVARAVGAPDAVEWAPGQSVDIDFPLLDGSTRQATVVSWRLGGADVALLRLDAGVEGARPAPLVDGTDVWGHTFRAFGYPAGADHGIWASGVLRAGQGSGLVQMEAQRPGPHIMEGFSGGPVWDDAQGGVVGMTVAAHEGESTAYLLPSDALVDEEILEPRCPFKGLAAFTEDDAEFFHGRDSDIVRVHTAVSGRAVTLVAGPSGCGKSSLVRAGVLPLLRADGMSVTELRPVPGVRPAAVVARALIGILEPDVGEVKRLVKAEELVTLLETGDDMPVELRSRVLARGERTGHVLFADQLEEYAGADPGAARDLFGMLATLAGNDGAAVLRVVATARPDSLGVLVTADTSELVSDGVQFLAPLVADDLERAVTVPVDAVPGVWFEPGLPERIVADAGNEPGRMPLVQFALTELWQRRDRSMLTQAAYDDLGGVAGALVKYADDTLDGLSQPQQDCAQRLFVQLARPGKGDIFRRRPTRTADLAPELLDLARKLAPGKLVVLSRAPGGTEGEEIIELAHEALIQLWPRLRQWLVDSRDFRAWQEQLRDDLRRWQTQHQESARLLTGADLVEAGHRLAHHSADISADERGYILLSRRHSRRGARLKQAAVGALAVLTVLAVVLALSTRTTLKHAEEQLRTQAAGLLAQTAEDRPGSDPTTAMQLALAAWNTEQTPETRQALLHQYARGQYLVGSYPSVWQGQVTGMDATADGRTLVVRSKRESGERQTISVVTGSLQGRPQARKLSGVPEGELVTALSPDGRLFAATARGALRLWRLSDPGPPQVLGLGDYDVPKEEISTFLDFSSDGKRLLLAMIEAAGGCYVGIEACHPFAGAWHVPSGTRIDVSDRIAPRGLEGAAFTSDADTVVTITSNVFKMLPRRIELRDLTTGRLLYTSTVANGDKIELRAGGEVLVTEVGDYLDSTVYSQVLGRAPGRKTVLPVAKLHPGDATSRYDMAHGEWTIDSDPWPGGYVEATLTDVRTGRTYRTRVPTSGETPAAYTGVAAVPRAGGGFTVLVPVGSALMAVRAEVAGIEQAPDDANLAALSPDGRSIARVSLGRLEVMNASRTRIQSVKLRHPNTLWPTWTADSQRIVLWDEYDGLYQSYSVRDLSDSVPLGDALPKSKEVDTVAALQGSEIAVLTEDGFLARVNAADGAGLGRPFLVDPTPNPADASDIAEVRSELVARPRHPGQVAVVTNLGATRGEILLWDTRKVRRTAKLSGPGIVVPNHLDTFTHGLAFDADGSHLAVQNSDGQVHVWDVDGRKKLARSASRSTDDTLVGFGPDDSIVTYLAEKKQIQIYDLTGGDATTLAVDGGNLTNDWLSAFVHGPYLTIETADLRQTFDLRPDAQFRTLCAAAGRDYTKPERKLLPDGTPSKPPCA